MTGILLDSPVSRLGCSFATLVGLAVGVPLSTGRIRVVGDLIVSGGENVLPTEVEEVLRRHPDVADAAAVGRADPEWQEAVTAVVVLCDGAVVDAEELRRHCAESLASHKVPKRFEFASELPRTASGKLMRRALR